MATEVSIGDHNSASKPPPTPSPLRFSKFFQVNSPSFDLRRLLRSLSIQKLRSNRWRTHRTILARGKPDITKAKELLGREPKIKLRDGLEDDFRKRLGVPRKN